MQRTAYSIDYDLVAPVYDSHPLRRKEPDPQLIAFLQERGIEGKGAGDHDGVDRVRGRVWLAVLDIGCGTGSQLVANLAIPELPSSARLIGLDPFAGMLRVARAKSAAIRWVQGDGMRLPFADATFDYATNQFSHHHMASPGTMLREVYRVLRPGGRFVLTNMAPREMADAQLYRWFARTRELDLAAHLPPDDLAALASNAGFGTLELDVRRVEWETTLPALAISLSRKLDCSQLNALPDAEFERCLAALKDAAAQEPRAGDSGTIRDTVAVLTLTAQRG